MTPSAVHGLGIGIDLVRINDMRASIDRFGHRWFARLYTPDEQAHLLAIPRYTPARAALHFAVKEAALKALDLGEAGVNWRDLEVRYDAPHRRPRLALHGRAAQLTAGWLRDSKIGLEHRGDYAVAFVTAIPQPSPSFSHCRPDPAP